jgi:DNA-binding NarL/FixJ family response regulator
MRQTADDHPLLLDGVENLVRTTGDMEVKGRAS